MQACFPGGFYCVQLGSAYTRMDPEMRHIQSLLPPSSGVQAQRTVQGAPPRWHGWGQIDSRGGHLVKHPHPRVSFNLPSAIRLLQPEEAQMSSLPQRTRSCPEPRARPASRPDSRLRPGFALHKKDCLVQGPIRPAGGARQAPWPAPQAPSNHLTAELLPPLPRAPAGGEASRCSDWTNSR